jgi:outer membrane receptor for ferrienterochelin and colicins
VKLILSLTALCLFVHVYAQDLDTLATQNLEAVIVTGQYEPQSVKKSVYQARVITLDALAAKGAVRLQDVLNTELNIRFSQDLALGGSNLSLQGLAGQNVKVLIDGVPMIGRQGTSNEININQLNVQSIERIEIIEGPMSVVYGADALAGVINIITKKTPDSKLELTAKLHEETVGHEYGIKQGIHNQTVGVGYARNKFHARADFNHNYFGGWQGTLEGREKQWHPKTQYLASALAGYSGQKTNAHYRADYLFENIYNPGAYFGGEALDQYYYTNRLMQQVQASHNFSNTTQATAVLGHTWYSRETQTTTVDESSGDERLALGEGLQDVTEFGGLTFRGTVQHKWNNTLSIQPGMEANLENGSGGRIKEGTQRMADYAVFFSAEWKITPWLHVRPGVRFLYNTVYQAPPAIPSLNAKIKLNEKSDLRLAYGRGFRAPSLRELYFDFFDASHAIEGNTDLEAEFSDSYNASWNYRLLERGQQSLSTTVGGFYNSVENMIGFAQKPSNILITTYLNIDRFKTQGFTWNNVWKSKSWNISAGLAYTGRYNELTESNTNLDEFNWSTEVTTSITYKIVNRGIILSAYHKFTGRTPFYELVTESGNTVARLAETGAFHWADVSVQKSFGKSIWLTVGARNLLDVTNINNTAVATGVHTPGGSRPIGYGRSYFISLSYSFNK